MKKGLLFTGLIVALTLVCCYALVAADAVKKELVVITEPAIQKDTPKATPVQTAPALSRADKAMSKLEMSAKEKSAKPYQGRLDGLLDCTASIPVACGDTYNGTTVGANSNVSAYSCVTWDESGPEVVHELTVTCATDTTITATISNLVGGDLDVFILDACDENNCIAHGDAAAIAECVTAGTYYIVVDGYGGAAASYTLDVTCTECVSFVPEECPVGSLFSQPPTHPDSAWGGGTADAGPGYLRADNFWGVCDEICDIHFWGLNLFHDGVAWNNCDSEDPMTFDITFYPDASGFAGPGMWTYPGAAACSYTVTLNRTATPYMYGGFQVYYYSTTLSPCCALSAGWVSIQGVSVGSPNDCWFLWASHGQNYAGYSFMDDGTGWAPDTYDFAFCLTGEGTSLGAIGACVNVETGICDEGIPCESCLGDFYWNMTCDQILTGACCDASTNPGTCTEDVFYGHCEYQGFDWYPGITCAEIFPPCGAALCDASGGGAEHIDNVELPDGFSNPSGSNNYTDYYSADPPGCARLYGGEANSITVTINSPYSSDIGGCWIDWNQDFDFDDAGELIFDGTSWAGFGPYTGTITPPVGTEGGCYLMRLRVQDSYYDPVLSPCGPTTWGEVEDYCVCVCNRVPIIEVPTGGPGPVYSFSETVNTCGYCAYVPQAHTGDYAPGCWVYYMYMGPSVLYMMHTYETGDVTVSITGNDPAMYIFTDLADPFGTCVCGSDWTGGDPSTETCVLEDLPPGIYYINVALYDEGEGRCGDVLLEISGDVQLPVELTSFEAIAGNNEVALTWTTAAELNNDYFEVQRSTDTEWTTVGTVDGTNEATGSSYAYTDRAVMNGVTYTYRLLSHDFNGAVEEYEMTAEATPQAPLPTEYALGQNFPNPFNPTTTITYALKDAGFVTLKVYNLLGQEVANLVSQQLDAGNYTTNFSGTNLPSGIYVYRLEVNDFSAQQKMVLLK